uniref:Candidate secreted effector n=1 Tax=Meloidogyne incognita TaxID=6306 RepID=A0A914M6F1_MELIC
MFRYFILPILLFLAFLIIFGLHNHQSHRDFLIQDYQVRQDSQSRYCQGHQVRHGY